MKIKKSELTKIIASEVEKVLNKETVKADYNDFETYLQSKATAYSEKYIEKELSGLKVKLDLSDFNLGIEILKVELYSIELYDFENETNFVMYFSDKLSNELDRLEKKDKRKYRKIMTYIEDDVFDILSIKNKSDLLEITGVSNNYNSSLDIYVEYKNAYYFEEFDKENIYAFDNESTLNKAKRLYNDYFDIDYSDEDDY